MLTLVAQMAVTPSGKMLACFTESGMLWVCSTDFQQNLTEFNPRAEKPPTQVLVEHRAIDRCLSMQLVWCGVDSVMLYWNISKDRDKLLLMVILLVPEPLI